MEKKSVEKRGVGSLELLTLLFIGLKLGGVITWHWFWVLSPVLIPTIALGITAVLTFIVLVIKKLMERR